tara:strand:+ start:516 stop:782 length:267 start_codon:yes stop_codon:yes gene_type:complete
MKSLKLIKKQILILFVLSVFISIGLIIHGIFFDLDVTQIKRLTIEGLILTLIIVFPLIIFLEWIFDLNNREKFDIIKKRIDKIEKKRK